MGCAVGLQKRQGVSPQEEAKRGTAVVLLGIAIPLFVSKFRCFGLCMRVGCGVVGIISCVGVVCCCCFFSSLAIESRMHACMCAYTIGS